jgi:hypothetical protein
MRCRMCEEGWGVVVWGMGLWADERLARRSWYGEMNVCVCWFKGVFGVADRYDSILVRGLARNFRTSSMRDGLV